MHYAVQVPTAHVHRRCCILRSTKLPVNGLQYYIRTSVKKWNSQLFALFIVGRLNQNPQLNSNGIATIPKMNVVGQSSDLRCRRCGYTDPDFRLLGCSCLLHVVSSDHGSLESSCIKNAQEIGEFSHSIMNDTSHVTESYVLIGLFHIFAFTCLCIHRYEELADSIAATKIAVPTTMILLLHCKDL